MLKEAADKLNLPLSYYYTTAVKCVTDKKPSMALIKKCNSYLKEEISIIKPKYVLVVGETAFKALLWDFDLITRRKPEIDSCAGSHIDRDGIIYFPVFDSRTIEKNYTKKYKLEQHLRKFVELATGNTRIKPVYYKEIESEKELIYIAKEAERTGQISVDIEAAPSNPCTPFLSNSEILSIAFSVKEGEAFCAPLSWPTGEYFKKWDFRPKVNSLLTISYINKILTNPNATKVFHNAAFDMTWLEYIFGYEIQNYDDTMIMKFLLNQNDQDRKGLKPLTKEYLDMGYYEYSIKQYVGEKESYSNIPPKILMDYNNPDADATLRLRSILGRKLKEYKLENVHYGFMIPKLRGIINLQKSGIAIDVDRCIRMKDENEGNLVKLFSELRSVPQVANFERLTGLEFMPSSDKHKFAMVYGGEITTEEEIPRKIVNGKKVGKKEYEKVFYNGFNLEPITVSTKSSVTGKREQRKSFGKKAIQKYLKSVFKEIEYLDPINTYNLDPLPNDTDIMQFIKIISEISTIQTQLSNHIDPFINVWAKTLDKCVHTSYDLTGTTTGRLASRYPNLQNLKRDGFVKEAFISRWGAEGILLEIDYKQLELFVMAIVSQDPTFVYAFTHGIDLHLKTAMNIVFRCVEDAVSKQMRTNAKIVNFGMIYGKTAFTLKDDLNVSEEEAERIIQDFFREYSGVYNYSERIKVQARAQGYVTTVMGRRRYLDYSDPNGADRQAVNTTIQSPASDVCVTAVNQLQDYFKKAMIKSVEKKIWELNIDKDERVAEVCMTVHDSIVVDTKKKYVNEVMSVSQLIMENTGLSWVTIPLKVDVKYGPNLRNMTEWTPGEEISV
jgi:DNA polymerase-1